MGLEKVSTDSVAVPDFSQIIQTASKYAQIAARVLESIDKQVQASEDKKPDVMMLIAAVMAALK